MNRLLLLLVVFMWPLGCLVPATSTPQSLVHSAYTDFSDEWWEQDVCVTERESRGHDPTADVTYMIGRDITFRSSSAILRCVRADLLWQIAMIEGQSR